MAPRTTGLGEINYFLGSEIEPKSWLAPWTTSLGEINYFKSA